MTEVQLQKMQVIVGILAVVIAIICGVLTIFTQVVSPFFPLWFIAQEATPKVSENTNITFHVFDKENGSPIQYARVLLFIENRRLTSETDDTGTIQFRVRNGDEIVEFDYVVQVENYNVERRNNVRYQGRKIDIPLNRSEGDNATVFFVVTDEDGASIPSAEVVLKLESTIISQPTDTNGIVKFDITFPNDTLDAQVSVNAKGFQPDYQNITLLPNKILAIRLDPNSRVFQPPCYTEAFSENKSDPEWHTPLPPTGTIRQYINEEYQLFSQTKEGVHWSRSSFGFFTNYTIQVEARWSSEEFIGQEYGLIFDRSGGNDITAKMYRFNVNTSNNLWC